MKINPQNFYQRKINFLPKHFVNTVVKANEYEMVKIEEWIYNYCTGRYCIVFENAGDLTLFGLSGLAQSR